MRWLSVNFLQTLPHPPLARSPLALPVGGSTSRATGAPHLRPGGATPIFSQIRRRRTLSSPPPPRSGAAELGRRAAAAATSQVPSSVGGTGRMDGTARAPSGAEPRVAAHPGVNGSGAARHLHDEWLEEYEAGVFMKLKDLGDGTRELKRVRFSQKRFGEHLAENWWKENREKVYERYNVRSSERASSAAPTHSA